MKIFYNRNTGIKATTTKKPAILLALCRGAFLHLCRWCKRMKLIAMIGAEISVAALALCIGNLTACRSI